ncbi:hypothetical protein NX722_13660 [Endozoicomonas gorgoniicola]|uniref:Uncharacterized protein n=1 Tax=Endozoicomonas gorgoniicola TaxID=1234144 RepID=A0ABT3MWA4_9GAMM|nr:hypothetical protein [Endozoicomonas gorgoniicola]MCW7553655.1 hypothetical protein [Endozoicomonas gorgoniicola]
MQFWEAMKALMPLILFLMGWLMIWNIYLFTQVNNLKMKVAEEYIPEKKIRTLLGDMESRLEAKLDLLLKMMKGGNHD